MNQIPVNVEKSWCQGQTLPGDGIIPTLVVVPPGEFIMGAPETEVDSNDSEPPSAPGQDRLQAGSGSLSGNTA